MSRYIGAEDKVLTEDDDDVEKVEGEVLFEAQTPYQKICLFVERNGSVSLTLDKYWQFYGPEEHIYHESLMTVPMLIAKRIKDVVILGGGDGLAVREALRFQELRKVCLVELDPSMIRMAREHPVMRSLNRDALQNKRAEVYAMDAQRFLKDNRKCFDVIVCDFPDPTSPVIAQLFSKAFYREVAGHLAPGGVVSVQGSSPSSELDFVTTYVNLASVFPYVRPYAPVMPTMGMAGMFVASDAPIKMRRGFPEGLRFLNKKTMDDMFDRGSAIGKALLSKYDALLA